MDDNHDSANMKQMTGNVTQGEDFPKQDAVGPYITLKCVDAVENALRRHPFDWQTSLQEKQQAQRRLRFMAAVLTICCIISKEPEIPRVLKLFYS